MYCTVDDIKNSIPEQNLIQLTDDDNTGSIDQDKVDAAIDGADKMIDGYLRGHYALPLAEPVPGIIKKLSVDLAVHGLYTRRFEMETPEGIRDRYKNAVKMLEMIQREEITLMDDAGEERLYKTNKTADDREFPKDKLDKF